MEITYHGYSCLMIEMENGQCVMIDPFITGNPLTDLTAEEVKASWLSIIHGHSDRIGDMIPIAKGNQATIISIVEITNYTSSRGVDSLGVDIGGEHAFPFGVVKFVYAQHSSSYEVDSIVQYMGGPSGIIIQTEGKTTYHVRDTAYFSDLGLPAEELDTDVAFLPIGDDYTVGPENTAETAQTIHAKRVASTHYSTFPVIERDPEPFMELLENSEGKITSASETLEVQAENSDKT